MENVDEQLKKSICSILDPVSEDTVNGIIQAVKYAGLESLSDLEFVQEEDLILVLKPIQRRKLIEAWSKEINSSAEENNGLSLLHSSVKESNSLQVQNCEWNVKDDLLLLQIYIKYKADFSSPNAEQSVWSKIADEMREKSSLNCDELQCCFRIEKLKLEFETVESEDIQNRTMAIFFDKARMAFETTEDPVNISTQSSTIELKTCGKKNREYCLKLLQAYAKFKTEFLSPDMEEQRLWEKIAREMREDVLYDCGEALCRFDVLRFKLLYEKLKTKDVISEDELYFFNEAAKAFEITDNQVISCAEQSHSLEEIQNCEWNVKDDFLLLQVYIKYKAEVLSPNVKQTVWRKIANEMKGKSSLNFDEFQCRNRIEELRFEYERVENQTMATFFDKTRMAFETAKNPVISPVKKAKKTKKSKSKKPRQPKLNKRVLLLQIYSKYKAELSGPDVEQQSIWKKISEELKAQTPSDWDASACRSKINELRSEYDRCKNNTSTKWTKAMVIFKLTEEAFETTNNQDEKEQTIKKEKVDSLSKVILSTPLVSDFNATTTVPNADSTNNTTTTTLFRDCNGDKREKDFKTNTSNSQTGADKKTAKYVPPHMRQETNKKSEFMKSSPNIGENSTIRVSNLTARVTKSDLQELFERFGPIARIYKSENKDFAYVKFHKQEDAIRAIQVVNGYEYDLLILNVQLVKNVQANETHAES